MRTAGVLFFLLLCLTTRAQAQVSVDMRALDPTGGAQPAARPAPAPTPARRPAAVRPAPPPVQPGARADTTERRPAKQTATAPVQPPTAPAPQAPALPTALPSVPPPSTMVPVPVAAPAPLPPPVRLVFEGGKADLTPADEAAIRELAQSIPAPAADSVNVLAYAAGKQDDPSTARRLSLSRGLAVRSVLLASGVPSAQIYVRALGATPSDGPADRVELSVAPIGTVTR
jgi:outer membrane protein OmpA-like peptidoglycan-associated protein